jgi:hypothetical protein
MKRIGEEIFKNLSKFEAAIFKNSLKKVQEGRVNGS